MLTHEKLENKLNTKNNKKTLKGATKRNFYYVIFSFVYFTISLIQIYVVVYIPLFHFDVLNVNRARLSLIQVFSYLILFSFPAFGLFFDRYSRYKKKVIISFSFLISLSFLIFALYNQFLLSYAVFLVLFLVSQAIIRTGMSKLLLEAPDKKRERNIIILINTSSSIGILLPSLLFKVCVKTINSLDFWKVFFILGWFITSPLLLIFIFMRKTPLEQPNQEYFPKILKNQNYMKDISILSMIFIFFANFCLWSDKLIAYPFSSYILSKFGETGFLLYSDFYVIFTILNIAGFHLAKRILIRIDFRNNPNIVPFKNILQFIAILTLIYIFCLFFLLFSNKILFLFTYSLMNLLSGLFVVLYANIFLKISRTGKNENFRYWIMSLSSSLASIIFLPVGTFLSPSTSTETLILIVISLTSISIVFLYLSRFSFKPKHFYRI